MRVMPAKTKKAQSKTGFTGGERTIVKELVYARDKYIEAFKGEDIRPIKKLSFDSEEKVLVGYAPCGEGCYFATSKAEAEQVIAFVKTCFGIE